MASVRRREDDPDDSGVKRRRAGGGLLNGHTRWVVGIVSTAMVAALGYLLVNDHSSFERRLSAVENHTRAVEVLARQAIASQEKHEAAAMQQWMRVLDTLEGIKSDVKELRSHQ